MSSEKKAALGLPQPFFNFLADSSSWNANGISNFRTVRQMLKSTEVTGF